MKHSKSNPQRTRIVHVRLDAQANQMLTEAVRQSGMTDSEIVRDCVKIGLNVSGPNPRLARDAIYAKWRELTVKNAVKRDNTARLKAAIAKVRNYNQKTAAKHAA